MGGKDEISPVHFSHSCQQPVQFSQCKAEMFSNLHDWVQQVMDSNWFELVRLLRLLLGVDYEGENVCTNFI